MNVYGLNAALAARDIQTQVSNLPNPSETWMSRDFGLTPQHMKKLNNMNLIENTGEWFEVNRGGVHFAGHKWRTTLLWIKWLKYYKELNR